MKAFVLAVVILLWAVNAQAVDRLASWTDNSTNETGFIVQKCAGICNATSTGWSQIAVTPANATSFLITGALPGSTMSYRVGATNGLTAWSLVVVDVLPNVSPAAPGVFTLPPCKTLSETAPGSGLYKCSP